MKKLFSLLAFLLLLTCVAGASGADGYDKTGDYQYDVLPDGTAEIVAYLGYDRNVVVPSRLSGHPVTSIGATSFSECSGIIFLTIPEGVISIGPYAFEGCLDLSSVTLPESLQTIGTYAFMGCDGLTSVSIPDSVTTVGDNPFLSCLSLTEFRVSSKHPYLSVVDGTLVRKSDQTLIAYPGGSTEKQYRIPNGIRAIGNDALACCNHLTSVTIPEGVRSIGSEAFAWSRNLSTVTVPSSVVSIGENAFFDCSGLRSVNVGTNAYAKQYCVDNGLPLAAK